MLRLGLTLSLLLPAAASAQERQFRALELTDGRSLRAEVLATEATGLRMRTPQGTTLVPFELLIDISPISEDDFEAQPPIRVWVHSPDRLPEITATYQGIPNLIVSNKDTLEGLAPGLVVQLDECGADFVCLANAIDDDDWMWFVTVLPPTDDSAAAYIFRGRASGGPPITRKDVNSVTADVFWSNAHATIGLIANSGAPKAVRAAFQPDTTNIPKDRSSKPGSSKLKSTLIGGGVGLGVGACAMGGVVAAGYLGSDTNQNSAIYAGVGGVTIAGVLVGGLIGNSIGKGVVPAVASNGRNLNVSLSGTW